MELSLRRMILIWLQLALSIWSTFSFAPKRSYSQRRLPVVTRQKNPIQYLQIFCSSINDDCSSVKTMKASVYIAVTIDGFIATTDGDVSFLDQYQEDPAGTTTEKKKENKYDFATFMNTVDVLIMGRKTFEKVLSFGPEMWAYGTTRVVVLSRQPETVSIPSHLTKHVSCSSQQDPAVLLSELSEQGFQHAYIDGGTTIQSFLRAGLIDQFILTRVPLLLGQGISLFSTESNVDNKPIELNHEDTVDLGNGLVTSCYSVVKKKGKES